MRNSGIKWIGDIPTHWKINKIRYTSYVKGRIGWQGLRSDEFTEEGPYLVTGTEFKNGKVDWEKCYHVETWRYEQDPYIKIRNDDVLITKDGTIGKVAIIEDVPGPTTLNSGVMLIRPLNNSYLPRFIYWLLESEEFIEYVEYTKVGSTIEHLYQETFENFSFAYPPSLDEQEQIFKYLFMETAKIDKAILLTKKLIRLFKEKFQALINDTVTRGLDRRVPTKNSEIVSIGEIPAHWKIGRLKRHASKIGSGKTPKGGAEVYVDDGIPLIRSQNVHFGGLQMDDVVYITPDIHQEMRNSKVHESDVLLNITGASLGRCTIVPKNLGEANVNQHVCIIRTKNLLDPGFLRYYLSSSRVQDFIYSIQVGASREGLRFEDIGSLQLVVPYVDEQIDEQRQISDYLERESLEISNIISQNHRLIKLLKEKREALIYQAICGKSRKIAITSKTNYEKLP